MTEIVQEVSYYPPLILCSIAAAVGRSSSGSSISPIAFQVHRA